MLLGLFRWCLYRTIPQCACTVPQTILAVGLEWRGAREPNHLHLTNCSLLIASQLPFPLHMSFLPFFLGDLPMVCCGCNRKLQFLVIPNKLSFFFFWKNNLQSCSSTFWWPILESREASQTLQGWWPNRYGIHIEHIVAHCFPCQPWGLRINLFPRSKLLPSLHFEAFQVLFEIYFKVFSSLILLCMWVLIWHFDLILKSDCSNWTWLIFAWFLWEQGLFHWTVPVWP